LSGGNLLNKLNGSIGKRVLIVVSAFNPAIIADMQRARMLAWELPKLGWSVEILTPRASEVRQDVVEKDAAGFFAPSVPLHEVGSVARWLFEALGANNHVWRTLWPMWRRGERLLSSKRFDLIYFTTTAFMYFALGPRWKRSYAVPYVVDFHDPWIKEIAQVDQSYHRPRRMLEKLSASVERQVLLNADGVVAVSPDYIDALEARYGYADVAWLAPGHNAVIPFGALGHDIVEAGKSSKPSRRESIGELDICYVGAGGTIMARSFALICRALATLRSQGSAVANQARLRLYGTMYNWKQGDAKPLELIARESGVGDLVTEFPERVSYRRSLELLLQSDGAIILGVDDAGYMPSKLFSYGLSGKPLLSSLRREGPAFAQFQRCPQLGHALWFDKSADMPLAEATSRLTIFLQETAGRQRVDRRTILEPFLATTMARRHVELFEACLSR
jgi:hypothetical protein